MNTTTYRSMHECTMQQCDHVHRTVYEATKCCVENWSKSIEIGYP